MLYSFHIESNRKMFDTFEFKEMINDSKTIHRRLSKKKILKNLSEFNEDFTPLHILILDNLSKISFIIYKYDGMNFNIHLNTKEVISLVFSIEDDVYIEQIFKDCDSN